MIHLAVDADGMPVGFLVATGAVADCTQACALIEGIPAEYLLADRGYDSREIAEKALAAGMQAVIPPRKNRKHQGDDDGCLYKLRHLVENAFLRQKRRHGIAARCARNTASFIAAVQIRRIVLWATGLT